MGLWKGTCGEGVREDLNGKGELEYLGRGYPGKKSLSTRCAGARLSTCVGGAEGCGGTGLGFGRGVGMLREVGIRGGAWVGVLYQHAGGKVCIRRN